MNTKENDEILNSLWEKNRNLEYFLNIIFGFLRRKTNVFHEYSKDSEPKAIIQLTSDIITSMHNTRVTVQRPEQDIPETYNGGSFNGYSWSQTIQDLEIQIIVPNYIKSSNEVKVNLSKEAILKVEIRNQENIWEELINDQLKYPIQFENCAWIWSLEPGKAIQIHLEKKKEMWWDALTNAESPINLNGIDASRPMEELHQEEQMKIAELFWKDRDKHQIDSIN